MRIFSSKEHRPVRTANRIVTDSICKDNAFRSKAVEIRGNHRILIHVAYSLLTELIGKYK